MEVDVFSRGKFKEVFWVAINHLGMVGSGKKPCNRPCNNIRLFLRVTKEMLPRSTIFVFATAKHNNKDYFVKDKIDVDFNQLSENYVNFYIFKFKKN